MDKSAKKHNIASVLLTLIVIVIYLVPNFVSAITLSITTDKPAYTSEDTSVTFTLGVDIENNERVPVQSLILTISPGTGDTQVECRFSTSGQELTECPNIEITDVSVQSYSPGDGFGYGYGYGPGDTIPSNQETYFGYGYGYGYGYGDLNPYPTELSYTVTWDFKTANAGSGTYIARLAAYADDKQGNEFTYMTTTPAQFSIEMGTAVEAAYNDLTPDKILGTNSDLYNVVSDLNLITVGLRDTKIKWASSNTSVINPFSGAVTRPGYDGIDAIVTLKANISKTGETSMSKEFTATILKESMTDGEAVAAALSEVTLPSILLLNSDENNILTNLNLSTTAANDVTLEWSSTNPSVIETTGSVSRTATDKTVTLTVVASRGIASGSKSFTFIVKGTADLDLINLSNAKLDLTDLLILNGNPAKDSIIGNVHLPTNLPDHAGIAISWTSDNSAIAANGTVTRSTAGDVDVKLTANLTKNTKTMSKGFALTVKKRAAPAEVVDNRVEVNPGETEIVVDLTNVGELQTIEVPSDVDEDEIISLNLDTLRDTEGKLNLSTNNLTLSRNTSSGVSYGVIMPQGSVVQGDDKWNGIINLPTVKATTEVTPTASAGSTISSVDVVIEVGFTQGQLNFTKAAKLTIPNMAGKKAGYTDFNGVFHTIPACTTVQVADPNSLAEGADCYTSDGADMIIWTKHFTKFAAYTETATAPPGGVDTAPDVGGGGGGGIPRALREEVPEPEPEPEPEEEIAEEEEERPWTIRKLQPKEKVEEPGGLAAITGRVISTLGKPVVWKTIGVIMIILILGLAAYMILFRDGGSHFIVQNDYDRCYNKAAMLHRKAEGLYRAGKQEKAEELYKKAQIYRERGERLQK